MKGKCQTEIYDEDRRIDFVVEIEWERWWEAGEHHLGATNVRVIHAVARFPGFLSCYVRKTAECPIDMSDVCMTAFAETYAADIREAIEASYESIMDPCHV